MNLASQVVLAQSGSTATLRTWLSDNVITVLMLVIGAVLLTGAFKGNLSRVMSVFGLGLVGVMWIGLATTDKITTVSTWMSGLVGF